MSEKDVAGEAMAEEMRALQALHTAKKPSVPPHQAAQLLADFLPQLAAVGAEERRQVVASRQQMEKVAVALLVWRYTPLALALPANDPAIDNDQAGEAALAVVEYGSEKVQETFLREVLVNVGHRGILRLLWPILVHGFDPALLNRVLLDVVRVGNELHAFNLLSLVLELRGRGAILIQPQLYQEIRKMTQKSKKRIVQRLDNSI
jgi:hypothetical protein